MGVINVGLLFGNYFALLSPLFLAKDIGKLFIEHIFVILEWE